MAILPTFGGFSNATFSDLGQAANDLFQGQAQSQSDQLKAQGDYAEATNYDLARQLALKNEQYTQESGAAQEAAATRQLALSTGATKTAVAGAGFANSGSALDIMRSSVLQGGVQQQLIGTQTGITMAAQQEQATSYGNLEQYAITSGNAEEQMGTQASQQGTIGALISGVAGVASMFKF